MKGIDMTKAGFTKLQVEKVFKDRTVKDIIKFLCSELKAVCAEERLASRNKEYCELISLRRQRETYSFLLNWIGE